MEPDGRSSAGAVPGTSSDSDRERTAEVIKAAFLEGRLDHDEYAERTRRALGSRSYSELVALTADLPAALLPATSSAAVPVAAKMTRDFDLPAVLLCVLSVSLGVGAYENNSPLSLLLAIIIGAAASLRARRGPTWERIAVWGTIGLTGLALAVVIAAFFR
ncbi:MAG TPA: DUF1707 domain-containing protein [Streptosporangiaceae bacterium]|nr:DUF1707 domain-containing protein [Streptosporangiaceae bacterium]